MYYISIWYTDKMWKRVKIWAKCEKFLTALYQVKPQADITRRFYITWVSYLELVATGEKMRFDLAMMTKMINWLSSFHLKDIETSLGFANFYERFV